MTGQQIFDRTGFQGIFASLSVPGLLVYQGTWSSGTAYATDSVVVFSGTTYIAVAGSTGVTPGTDPTKWVAIASGATGPAGPSGIFGSGTDGSATLDGTATVAWASKSGSTYTMTRDCFCTSLAINSGVTLNTGNARIFVAGAFSNAGTVQNLGANASGATGGAATASIGLTAGGVGGNGLTGQAGGGPTGRAGAGNPGGGGTGSSGAGGSQGGVGAPIFTIYLPQAVMTGTYTSGGAARLVSGAAGGGGGGGDGTNSGGGGGAGGGIIAIFAWSAVNTGAISANGGNGATPSTGNCGGGGAGGGGVIIAFTLAAWTAGTTSVAAGTAGSGVGTGTAGGSGTAGTVVNLIIQ